MPDSNRNIYVAIGLALLILSSVLTIQSYNLFVEYQNQHTEQRESISNYKAETNEQYSDNCLKEPVSIFFAFKCLIDSIDASREARRSKYDLQAQQEMAEWAYALFLLTLAGLIISLLGLTTLFISLYQTRTVIRDTREIGEAQVRAYVSIKSAEIYFVGTDAMPIVQIVAINNGQTPAVNFVWVPELSYLQEKELPISKKVPEDWFDRLGVDIHPSKKAKPIFGIEEFALVPTIKNWIIVPRRVAVSVKIHFAWYDVFNDLRFDEASFAGIAERGSVVNNRKYHNRLNTSAWGCKLHPIAKGEMWSGIAINAEPKKKRVRKKSPQG